jgi:hypothetical protein
MALLAHLIPPLVPLASDCAVCPRCGGVVFRTQRRLFDRFIGLFLSVYRYRCGSLGCAWEGNLHVRQKSTQK